MKNLSELFKHNPIYILFRFSWLYYQYQRIFRPAIYFVKKREFRFYKNLNIPAHSVIFDIGSNIGDKTYQFSKIAKRVISVEPDKHNYHLLRTRFIFRTKIKSINFALAEKSGKSLLYINSKGSPVNTLSDKWRNILTNPKANRWAKSLVFDTSYEVSALTLQSLIESYGIPYYVKIDVEGFELEVIKGLKTEIPIISFEANFPDFKKEFLQCIDHLGKIYSTPHFNCSNENHIFFWEKHISQSQMLVWLKDTKERYFEIYCFK